MPVEGGRPIDWSRASADYAAHRAGYAEGFFDRLQALDVMAPGQVALDVGTGTGLVARALARRGLDVIGIDVAEGQIAAAQSLAQREGVLVRFEVAPAEALPVGDASADLVIASMCWMYLDEARALDEVRRVLRPGGHLVIAHLYWLAEAGSVAEASERLVLAHNPAWLGAGWDGVFEPRRGWPGLPLAAFFVDDVDIPYTREGWRGRMRACRGMSPTLDEPAVARFDEEHARLLEQIAPPGFSVRHRYEAQAFRRVSGGSAPDEHRLLPPERSGGVHRG